MTWLTDDVEFQAFLKLNGEKNCLKPGRNIKPEQLAAYYGLEDTAASISVNSNTTVNFPAGKSPMTPHRKRFKMVAQSPLSAKNPVQSSKSFNLGANSTLAAFDQTVSISQLTDATLQSVNASTPLLPRRGFAHVRGVTNADDVKRVEKRLNFRSPRFAALHKPNERLRLLAQYASPDVTFVGFEQNLSDVGCRFGSILNLSDVTMHSATPQRTSRLDFEDDCLTPLVVKEKREYCLNKPRLVAPKERECCDKGIRRSSRTKIPTCRKWMNEFPIYEYSPGGTQTVVGITDVMVTDKTAQKYLTTSPTVQNERRAEEKRRRKKQKQMRQEVQQQNREKFNATNNSTL